MISNLPSSQTKITREHEDSNAGTFHLQQGFRDFRSRRVEHSHYALEDVSVLLYFIGVIDWPVGKSKATFSAASHGSTCK